MYGGNNQFYGNAAFTQTASDHSNRDSQTFIPLTVKQISEAFQSSDWKTNFLIDGVDVSNVELVGTVCNKTDRVTVVSFVVDDGTGRLDCFRWVNEAADTKEMEAVTNGMYVRVHGHLKGFQQLMVYSVRPVDDYNEIASRFAEVVNVHSYNSRKQQDSSLMSAQVPNSSFNTPFKGYLASAANQFSGFDMEGISEVDKMVLHFLQQPWIVARKDGVLLDELVRNLKVPIEEISEAIHALEYEGLAYSTIDDRHYKSTIGEYYKEKQDSSLMSAQVPSSSFNNPLKGHQASASNQFNMDWIGGVDKMILDYLQQPSCVARKDGVLLDELVRNLEVPIEEILEAIHALENEGLAYSTIDDRHYKSTLNG